MIRVEVVISYGEELKITVNILGIPIKIIPKKEKKIRLRNFSVRNREKYETKQRLAAEKKGLKKEKKQKKKAADREKKKSEMEADAKSGKKIKKRTVSENVSMITHVVKTAVSRFGKHLRIRIARLHLTVGSEDAATTAILYGILSQSICYLAALLDSTSTLRHPSRADVDIHADYLSEKITCDIEIGFSLRVWQVLDMGLLSGIELIKHMK